MKKFVAVAASLLLASVSASALPVGGIMSVSAKFTPSSVSVGQSTTFTWSATYGSWCDIEGLPGGSISGGSSGSSTFAATGPVTATVWCENGDAAASRTAYLTVSNSAPQVTASFTPSTVYVGGTGSTFKWSSSYATSCYSPELGGVSGTSGSVSVAPAASPSQQAYTVTCTGANGSTSASATLKTDVKPIAPPTLYVYANPSFLMGPGWTTISYYSPDTAGCTGSYMAYASYSTSFNAWCSGPGGTSTAWTYVSVMPSYTFSGKVGTASATMKDGKAVASTTTTSQANLKHLGIDLAKKRYASISADLNKDGVADVVVVDAARNKAYIVLNTNGQYAIAKTVDDVSSITQIKGVFVPKSNAGGEIVVTLGEQQ
jgi:hypothetical protein